MQIKETQLALNLGVQSGEASALYASRLTNGKANKLNPQDRAFHDWYRFVLSFPPHLVKDYISVVKDYISDFKLNEQSTLLDPFCGTGTTLIEARLCGTKSIGLEAHPFSHFAARVKLDWEINPNTLLAQSRDIAYTALNLLNLQGIEDDQIFSSAPDGLQLRVLNAEAQGLLLRNSISPLPLHKALVLLDCIKAHQHEPYYNHALLAFANTLVFKISNLHFGPEVGVRKAKIDVPVISNWLAEVEKMVNDLQTVQGKSFPDATVHLADSRQVGNSIEPNSIDAVITSPPYPNEKDYTRTTRLETVLLGFVSSKMDLRGLKKNLLRSNTRGVYKDDDDDQWIDGNPEIQKIAKAIEQRRIELNKDSGFERLYARVTKLYFGGMTRHLANLRNILRPGAQLAYVVGDQASYLRVKIPTGQLLADIAYALGYEIVRTDLFRTRLATATKEQLREEVLVLRWSEMAKGHG